MQGEGPFPVFCPLVVVGAAGRYQFADADPVAVLKFKMVLLAGLWHSMPGHDSN